MADAVAVSDWVHQLMVVDQCTEFLIEGGSIIRVVTTADNPGHATLETELARAAGSAGLHLSTISANNCDKLQLPHRIVGTLAHGTDLPPLFRSIASTVWTRIGYPSSAVTATEVGAHHGLPTLEIRRDFRDELQSLLREKHQLSRDFAAATRHVINGVIDGTQAERLALGQFESYLTGNLTARELFQLGVQKKISRETATSALRNLLALHRLAGRSGALLHLDLRWATNHEQLPKTEAGGYVPTKQARTSIYQWVRELIDSLDRFSSTFICVEFGPNFRDPAFHGRGWGIYDALRLRLEDGVKPADGPNPSASFVPLAAS